MKATLLNNFYKQKYLFGKIEIKILCNEGAVYV